MKWFYKLERKYGKYAIRNLMHYIIAMYAVGYVILLIAPEAMNYLTLDMSMVLKGQVWRLFTFLMYPPASSAFFIIFTLYLYYMLGTVLERIWGPFKFNVYFFMGVIFHILIALFMYLVFGIVIEMTTYYLNMSIFFAYATTFPDMQFMIFFIIPVKVKWLAIFDAVFFAISIAMNLVSFFMTGYAPYLAIAVAMIVSVLNFIIFFFVTRGRRISIKQVKRKVVYQTKVKTASAMTKHKCAICGRTENDGDLTFRYCSKCEGDYEYCQDHLYTHEHVIKTNKKDEGDSQ
ncbi:MAG: hypothetical protein IKL73_01475 [Lachnospiraceae bacterium]|nr:hypothetical protein [Lachnospira sp.]MBR6696921.1 hypothetical protein [Lachnospiraceae bacterium]